MPPFHFVQNKLKPPAFPSGLKHFASGALPHSCPQLDQTLSAIVSRHPARKGPAADSFHYSRQALT